MQPMDHILFPRQPALIFFENKLSGFLFILPPLFSKKINFWALGSHYYFAGLESSFGMSDHRRQRVETVVTYLLRSTAALTGTSRR
jgi:hypothetical protein